MNDDNNMEHNHARKKINLGELIKIALSDSLEEPEIYTAKLRDALIYMYAYEMIDRSTYLKFRWFFKKDFWQAEKHFDDGSTLYFGKDYFNMDARWRGFLYGNNIIIVKADDIREWAMTLFEADGRIRDYLCVDSLEDLISSAQKYEIPYNFYEMADWLMEMEPQFIVYKGTLFYFDGEEIGYSLMSLPLEGKEPVWWFKSDKTLIRNGMSGEIFHIGDDFFFAFSRTPACLHFNAVTKAQEICYNMRFYEGGKGGRLLFKNTDDRYLYLLDEKLVKTRLVAVGGIVDCEFKDDYILAKTFMEEVSGYHITFDGNKEPATPNEKAVLFWNDIINGNTNLSEWIIDECDMMFAEKVRKAVRGTILSINDMEKIFHMIDDAYKWRDDLKEPFLKILNRLRKIGIDGSRDISDEMEHLISYHRIITDNDNPFSNEFCRIFMRLSRRKNFRELLKNNPEELFAGILLEKADFFREQEEERHEDLEKPQNRHQIGCFDVINGKFEMQIVSINSGIIDGVYVKPEEHSAMRGRIWYNMETDKYVIVWHERDMPLINKVVYEFGYMPFEVTFMLEKQLEKNE